MLNHFKNSLSFPFQGWSIWWMDCIGKSLINQPKYLTLQITFTHSVHVYTTLLYHSYSHNYTFITLLEEAIRKQYSPHHHTNSSLDCWLKAGWLHGFSLLTPDSDSTICGISRNPDSSDKAMSLTVQCWWVCVTAASDFCCWPTAVQRDTVSAVVDHSHQQDVSVDRTADPCFWIHSK